MNGNILQFNFLARHYRHRTNTASDCRFDGLHISSILLLPLWKPNTASGDDNIIRIDCSIFCYAYINTFQSTKLFTSIYLCEWYKLNCNCFNDGKSFGNHTAAVRGSIFILLERTKRPTIVIAGRFIKLTYESFIMVE